MSKSYGGLQRQVTKVREAMEKLTPPGPDDEFEDLRRSTLQSFDKVQTYLHGRVTGDGGIQAPEAE